MKIFNRRILFFIFSFFLFIHFCNLITASICSAGFIYCNENIPFQNPENVLTMATSGGNASFSNDSNNSQYLQGYTPQQVANLYVETDTLDTVTDRGSITSNNITVGNITSNYVDVNTEPLGTDASVRVNSALNKISCINLTEGDLYGFSICNDGNGVNRFVVSNYNTGFEYFVIDRDAGMIYFNNDTTFTSVNINSINATGNINSTGNITANYFIGNGSSLTSVPAFNSTYNGIVNNASYVNNNTNQAFTNNSNNFSLGRQNLTNGNITNINFLCNNSGTCFNINDLNKTSNISYFNLGRVTNNVSLGRTNFTNGNLTNINQVCNNTGSCFTLSQLNGSSGSISENQTFNFVNITRNLTMGTNLTINVDNITKIGKPLIIQSFTNSITSNMNQLVLFNGTSTDTDNTGNVAFGTATNNFQARVGIYETSSFPNTLTDEFALNIISNGQSVMGFSTGTNAGTKTIQGYTKGDSAGNIAYGALNQIIFENRVFGYSGQTAAFTKDNNLIIGTYTDDNRSRLQVGGNATVSQYLEVNGNDYNSSFKVIGNLITETCEGTLLAGCGSLGEAPCGEVSGCGWDDVCAGDLTCSVYNEADCATHADYCNSDLTCGGTHNACSTYGVGDCTTHGCTWSDPEAYCAGTFDCSVYGEGDCNSRNPYCTWNMDTCNTGPYFCSNFATGDCTTFNACYVDDPAGSCLGDPHTCQQTECDASTDGCANSFTSCSNDGTCGVIADETCLSYAGCNLDSYACEGSILDTACSQISVENCLAEQTGYCSTTGGEEDIPVVTAVSGLGQTNDTYQCVDQAGNIPWYSDYSCKLFATDVQFGNVSVTGSLNLNGNNIEYVMKKGTTGSVAGAVVNAIDNHTENSNNVIFAVLGNGTTGTMMPHFWIQNGAASQASGVSRSFMIVNERVDQQNTSNLTSCVAFAAYANQPLYIDCNTTTTGADLLVGDDIQAFGDAFLNNTNITGLLTTGNIHVEGNVSIKRPYGMWSSNITQIMGSASTVYPIDFEIDEGSYEITKTGNQNFSVQQKGIYFVGISAIFSTDSPNKHVELWIQYYNATAPTRWSNVPRSNTRMVLPSAATEMILAVSFSMPAMTTDIFRIAMATDDAGSELLYIKNTSYSPETPSIIMAAHKISELGTA